MFRWFLTAVLLSTQLFSWSAAPVYVCLANDGSVGMHLGNSACCNHDRDDACEHGDDACEHATCKCHHRHCHKAVAAHEHRETHSLAPSLHSIVRSGCDCTHIQISQ